MALCECPARPSCAYHNCSAPADWSIRQPPWGRSLQFGRFKFMCDACWKIYHHAMTTPMKGIDRPDGADEDWRGSILDHLRHARIAMAFEERNRPRPMKDSRNE